MINFTLRHLKSYLISTLLFLIFYPGAFANGLDFETTRLKSTAGAGVGSILMDEATILNPAPLAFYKVGSIYLNKGSAENTDTGQSTSDDVGMIVSDASGNAAGSISYHTKTIGNLKRQRIAVAMSSAVSDKSAMGMSLRRTTNEEEGQEKTSYLQTVMGITHMISPAFSTGFVVIDPFKERPEDSLGTFGTQYVYKDFISIMLDIGANFYLDVRSTFVYRSAIQFKLLDDFYARVGYFRDLGQRESGTGVGIGWVQPRLVLEAALKNTQTFSSSKVSESSFSLSYRF